LREIFDANANEIMCAVFDTRKMRLRNMSSSLAQEGIKKKKRRDPEGQSPAVQIARRTGGEACRGKKTAG
jgi:hypothetical protein